MSCDWKVCGPARVKVKLPVDAGESGSWERHVYLRFASLHILCHSDFAQNRSSPPAWILCLSAEICLLVVSSFVS